MAARVGTALVAMLPLLPAFALFHRFSPDRVKASSAARRRSPLTILNQWLRPLAKVSAPLFGIASRLPGLAGQVVGDIALTLATSPSAILGLAIANFGGLFVPLNHSIGILFFGTAFWGILASDISTRDFSADMEGVTGVVPGGSQQRYLRQFLATMLLGMLFGATIFVRDLLHYPLHALILLVGMFSLAALASVFGRTARTSRPFVALFMFWLYIALNATKEANVDVVGFNGVANAHSMMVHLTLGVVALVAGYGYNRWRSEE
ncbi:MAG: hypothetical protein HYZ45_02035 [Burkholderiales bacterium]|nr:hypothetical protein [Burkholderiales bacterium]